MARFSASHASISATFPSSARSRADWYVICPAPRARSAPAGPARRARDVRPICSALGRDVRPICTEEGKGERCASDLYRGRGVEGGGHLAQVELSQDVLGQHQQRRDVVLRAPPPRSHVLRPERRDGCKAQPSGRAPRTENRAQRTAPGRAAQGGAGGGAGRGLVARARPVEPLGEYVGVERGARARRAPLLPPQPEVRIRESPGAHPPFRPRAPAAAEPAAGRERCGPGAAATGGRWRSRRAARARPRG